MIITNNLSVWETTLTIFKDFHLIIASVADPLTLIIPNQALVITIKIVIWCKTHKIIRDLIPSWLEQILERKISRTKIANSHHNLMVLKEWDLCNHQDLNKIWIRAQNFKIKGQLMVILAHSAISNRMTLTCKTILTTHTINKTKWCITAASLKRLDLEALKQ